MHFQQTIFVKYLKNTFCYKKMKFKIHKNPIMWALKLQFLKYGFFLNKKKPTCSNKPFLHHISKTHLVEKLKFKTHQNLIIWPLKLLILMRGIFLKEEKCACSTRQKHAILQIIKLRIMQSYHMTSKITYGVRKTP